MSKSVFISSTSIDLKEYREEVDAAIRRLEMRPINMKDFGSQPGGASVVSIHEVSKADIFVGIVAQRYGYIPEGMEKSVTEQEYDEAVRLKIPRLMYLLDLNTPWDEALIENDQVAQKRLRAFRSRIEQNEVRSLFTSPDNLARQVAIDLTKFVDKQKRERFLTRVALPLITFLIVIITLGILVYTILPKVPPIETSSFNVAIASFMTAPDSGVSAAYAQDLSNDLYENFQREISGWSAEIRPDVAVWSPAQVGTVIGKTNEERAQSAAILANSFRERDLKVDIIVYGVIEKVDSADQQTHIRVVPEFYIASQDAELDNLLGRFEMQEANSPEDDNRRTIIATQLSKQARILAFITQGLVLISVPDRPLYENAYQVFTAALNTGLPDENGKELIHILIGNTKLGEYNQVVAEGGTDIQIANLNNVLNEANEQFLASTVIKPAYARAKIGQATSLYLSIVQRVASNNSWMEITENELEAIEKLYEEALTIDDSDPLESADIPTKYAFGMGQLYLMRYLRGDSEAWERAKDYFNQVIADYDNGTNERVREQAAQANGYIGLLHSQKNEFDAAIQAYQHAIDLTMLEVRQTLFKRALLQITFDTKRATGDIDDAVAAADEMLKMRMLPRDKAIILFHKGKMLSENNRTSEALSVYQSAIGQLNIKDDSKSNSADIQLAAQLWALVGDIRAEMGESSDAIEAYQQARQLDPITYSHLDRVIEKLNATPSQP
jgi:tetratricopeptide (TPR) repeat protein